ncbi:hypothetical protein R3P38DRAFT_3366960 [Favolaschia claudopus]|uniref:Uncharacterized protein n=1 Tax=Favolaschia claudopus TaxID=2862362 RepID=A0AAW0AAR0_9AGAR
MSREQGFRANKPLDASSSGSTVFRCRGCRRRCYTFDTTYRRPASGSSRFEIHVKFFLTSVRLCEVSISFSSFTFQRAFRVTSTSRGLPFFHQDRLQVQPPPPNSIFRRPPSEISSSPHGSSHAHSLHSSPHFPSPDSKFSRGAAPLINTQPQHQNLIFHRPPSNAPTFISLSDFFLPAARSFVNFIKADTHFGNSIFRLPASKASSSLMSDFFPFPLRGARRRSLKPTYHVKFATSAKYTEVFFRCAAEVVDFFLRCAAASTSSSLFTHFLTLSIKYLCILIYGSIAPVISAVDSPARYPLQTERETGVGKLTRQTFD